MKISIFASIGAQNLGDELILKNEIKLLEKKYPEETEFRVFTYDKNHTFYKNKNVEYKEYFPIGIREPKNILKNFINFFVFLFTVLRSDLIVVGGGGIIYDNENQLTKSPLDLWNYRAKIFRFFRKKVDFFRLGLNIKDKENYSKVKSIFKKANFISVRDKYSYELLKELGIDANIEKDPVFYDKGELETSKSLIGIIHSTDFSVNNLSKFDLNGINVGLAFRSGYLVKKSNVSDRMEEGKIKEIINYITTNGGEVTLLPHSFHKRDFLANDFVFLEKFAGEKVEIKKTMEEVYDVYRNKEIDLCFSMRLHSIILSYVYKIPFVGISYSKKTEEILNSLKEIIDDRK